MKAEGNYVNGEFDGYYAEYFPSGKVYGESTLKMVSLMEIIKCTLVKINSNLMSTILMAR